MRLVDPEHISTVAIIGCGTIGAGWASLFLARGLDVRAYDPADGAETRLRAFIERAWPILTELGLPVEGANPTRLRFCPSVREVLTGAQFVQESAPERLEHKRTLMQAVDASIDDAAVFASSSSGFMASEIQAGLACANRVVIGHPFNPPHLIPLVEVIGGERTDPAAVEWAMAFYRRCGKIAIRLNKELPGHLVNRLQAALWREAVHAVAEGVASVKDVDAAIAYGPGLRWALMGPHMTFSLAGGEGGMAHFLEHIGDPMEAWWRDLGTPSLTDEVRRTLIAGVAAADARSPAELAALRDQRLLELLKLRANQDLDG